MFFLLVNCLIYSETYKSKNLQNSIFLNFEATKFHLSWIIGLSSQQYADGILCAQKPPFIRGILSVKNHLHMMALTHSCYPPMIVVFDIPKNFYKIFR